MSSGTSNRPGPIRITDVYYKTYTRNTVNIPAWTLEASNVLVSNYVNKTWSGANRPTVLRDRFEKESRKRFYTIPVKKSVLITKGKRKGQYKEITIPVKKHFYTRPIPKRYRDSVNNAPHDYTFTKTRFRDDILNGLDIWPSNSPNPNIWYVRGDTVLRRSAWPTYGTLAPFDDNDQITLVNKLRDKVRGSSFDLSVFLGEGRETLKLITSSALKLAEFGWYLRKGYIKQAVNVLFTGRQLPQVAKHKTISENWLTLQYGVLPVLSDMKEGAEQLAHILSYPKTEKYSVRIRREAEANGSHRYSTAKKSLSRNLTAYVTEPESLIRLSGLLDPEIVAWELVPFSFVSDWVIPIGDYLRARAFANSLQTKYVVTTDVIEERFENYREQFWNVYDRLIFDGNSVLWEDTSYNRVVSNTITVPTPAVKPLGKIATWIHAANAVALMSAVFSSTAKPRNRTYDGLLRDNSSAFRDNRSEYIPQWHV